MGQAVVHFEVVGKDGEKLQRYYGELFGWNVNADNPMQYGMVDAKDNTSLTGEGHVTFYVVVPDVEEALQKAESLGGTRVMGPEKIMDMVELGQFKDPEGNVIGLVKDQQM
jgi:uncharacterized protein